MVFFNQSFWQQIVTAVVSGIILMGIASLFSRSSRPSQSFTNERTSKKIKFFLILFRIMLWGGLYMFIANVSVYGFSSVYTGLGFSLAFIGLIGLWATKLSRYWLHG